MVKTVGFVILWIVGSSAAVAVAWTGVAIVDNEAISPAPAPIDGGPDDTNGEAASGIEGSDPPSAIRSDAASSVATRSAGRTDPTIVGRSSGNSPSPGAGSSAAGIGTAPARRTTASAAGDASPTSRPPTPTTRTTTGSTATQRTTTTTRATTASTASPTTATTAPPTQTITFTLVGGSTAVSFSPAGASVLWATPNPGFDVDIGNGGPGMRVEFRADHHESRIDVWWSGGPQKEIREQQR